MLRFASLLLFGFIFSSAHAQDLYDLYKNSKSRKPYIEFLARDGIPGHSFVAIGEELDNGLLFQIAVYGFYPDSVLRAWATRGVIDHKLDDMQHDIRFRKYVGEARLAQAKSVFETYKDEQYSLIGNNCNAFAKAVAQAAGLPIPPENPGTTLPYNYMKAMQKTSEVRPEPPLDLKSDN